jgi:hypothetical protein
MALYFWDTLYTNPDELTVCFKEPLLSEVKEVEQAPGPGTASGRSIHHDVLTYTQELYCRNIINYNNVSSI